MLVPLLPGLADTENTHVMLPLEVQLHLDHFHCQKKRMHLPYEYVRGSFDWPYWKVERHQVVEPPVKQPGLERETSRTEGHTFEADARRRRKGVALDWAEEIAVGLGEDSAPEDRAEAAHRLWDLAERESDRGKLERALNLFVEQQVMHPSFTLLPLLTLIPIYPMYIHVYIYIYIYIYGHIRLYIRT